MGPYFFSTEKRVKRRDTTRWRLPRAKMHLRALEEVTEIFFIEKYLKNLWWGNISLLLSFGKWGLLESRISYWLERSHSAFGSYKSFAFIWITLHFPRNQYHSFVAFEQLLHRIFAQTHSTIEKENLVKLPVGRNIYAVVINPHEIVNFRDTERTIF